MKGQNFVYGVCVCMNRILHKQTSLCRLLFLLVLWSNIIFIRNISHCCCNVHLKGAFRNWRPICLSVGPLQALKFKKAKLFLRNLLCIPHHTRIYKLRLLAKLRTETSWFISWRSNWKELKNSRQITYEIYAYEWLTFFLNFNPLNQKKIHKWGATPGHSCKSYNCSRKIYNLR